MTMSIYNLIEYSVNYSFTSGRLWHSGRDEIMNNGDVTHDDDDQVLLVIQKMMEQKME